MEEVTSHIDQIRFDIDQLTKQFDEKPNRQDVVAIIEQKGTVEELVKDI